MGSSPRQPYSAEGRLGSGGGSSLAEVAVEGLQSMFQQADSDGKHHVCALANVVVGSGLTWVAGFVGGP